MATRALRSQKKTNAVSASPLVAVVGSLMMDMVFETQRGPQFGESHTAESLARLPGGKGANVAVSTYRASHRRASSEDREPAKASSTERTSRTKQSNIQVFMNAAVGDDETGRALRQNLQSNGVDTTGIVTIKGGETGVCAVMVDVKTKESRMVAYDGPRMKYKPRDPNRIDSLTGETGEKPDLLIVGLEVPREVIEPLLLTAAKADVDTILNPSPVAYIGIDTYASVTHLILNEVEAADLSGCTVEELKSVEVQKSSAEKFIRQGVKNVVLTLGEHGAYYATQNGESGHVPAEKDVVIKDTTGAGDSFLGAYAVEYLWQKQRGEWDIEKAISWGCKAAAQTIATIGAQEALPWLDDIESK